MRNMIAVLTGRPTLSASNHNVTTFSNLTLSINPEKIDFGAFKLPVWFDLKIQQPTAQKLKTLNAETSNFTKRMQM